MIIKNINSSLSTLSICIAMALLNQSAQANTTDIPTLQTITVKANTNNSKQTENVYTDDYVPAQQAGIIGDFLDVVPGVTVGGTSALNQRINIRGLDDRKLKVTIDGARQENYLFHHMGDLVLDPDLIKQAEVSVGNNSVTLGSNAIGGGVAFETVDAADMLAPNQTIGAKLKTSYASNNDELLTSAAVYGKPSDNVDLLAYFGRRNTKAGEDGQGKEIQADDGDFDNILLKAKAYITPTSSVNATFEKAEISGKFPIRPDFPMTDENGFNPVIEQEFNRKTYTIGYNYNPVNPLVDVDAKVYQTETEILRSNGVFDAESKTTGGEIKNTSLVDSQMGSHRVITGVEHYKKETSFKNVRNGKASAGDDEATNTSIYIEDAWNVGNLTLTPGIRYDRYKGPKDLTDGKTYNNVVGALAANYKITPTTSVFASYTQLFNGPDLNEAIRNTGGKDSFVNPSLEPETGDNKEVGIATVLKGLANNNDTLNLSAKYFHTDLEDVIESVSGLDCTTGKAVAGGKCRGSINLDEDYTIKGVELAADYNVNNFNLGLSYARARSEGDKTGYNLQRDTGDKYMMNIAYQPTNEFMLGWISTYVSDLTPKTESPEPVKEAYDVHDIYMTYKPQQFKGLTATVGVYNLFDEHYANHSSRYLGERERGGKTIQLTDYEPGRSIKASLSYQF